MLIPNTNEFYLYLMLIRLYSCLILIHYASAFWLML